MINLVSITTFMHFCNKASTRGYALRYAMLRIIVQPALEEGKSFDPKVEVIVVAKIVSKADILIPRNFT